jgi:hypothetical protein
MREALKSDRKLVVDIVSQAFLSNPSVLYVVKKDGKLEQRVRYLAEYSFDTGFLRDGVFLSDDNLGVAICYPYNKKKEGLRDYINQIKLIFSCIGLSRVRKVMKREAYIKKHRPKDGNFLYFWFLGVSSQRSENSTIVDIKEGLFKQSEQLKLPIYLETSVEKNRRVYERYGFEVYHIWEVPEEEYCLYFMRRLVISGKS